MQRRQSRGRHLNHCYYIVIQSQLPIYSIILLISRILTTFSPAFVSFLDSASFPFWIMGSQERTPSWQSKLLDFEMRTAIYLTRAVRRRFQAIYPKCLAKTPFFALPSSGARFSKVPIVKGPVKLLLFTW